jgi:Tol biopolymer transport system component
MMSRVIRRLCLPVFGAALALLLLALLLRLPPAHADMLVLEVSDRSALYLVDIGRALSAPLLRGRVEAPSWSPDGRRIAYLAGTPRTSANTSIQIMDVQAHTSVTVLPPSPGMHFTQPVWSPDGTRLVFAGRDEANSFNYNIYIINADGTHLRQLTGSGTNDTHPVWSPDGRQIAFSMFRGSSRTFNPNIVVVDADCDTLPGGCYENMRPVTRHISARYPRWSPDGRQIAFIYGDYNQLYVINVDGSDPRRLVRREGLLWFEWSPDSGSILFASSLAPQIWRLALVDVDTAHIREIESDRNAVAPLWSPDGRQIAFLGVDNRQFNVYIMDSDGGNVRQLTGRKTDGFRFGWAPG